MKRIGLSALLIASCVSAGISAQSPESLRGVSTMGFNAVVADKQTAFAAGRHVRVSGNVRLSGSGYAGGRGSRFVRIYLDGWTSVRGADGVQSGQFHISESVGVFTHDNRGHYSEYVRIHQNVSLYKDGRFVGSAWIGGSIWVSGWKNGSWLRLSGSGTIDGSVFVDDKDENAHEDAIEGRAVGLQAKATLCRLTGIEGRECLYSCGDGSTQRRPMNEPDPFGRGGPVIACPQILIPF